MNGADLKPGYEADASVTVEEKADALSVMQSAVQIRNGQSYVWVAVNGVASQKPVKTGLRSDKRIEILEGLQEGDRVIVYPPSELTEGGLVVSSGTN
jgi:HlyD family secretion protein